MVEAALAGCAVLVVEDEYWLAADIRRELDQAGAKVIGPAPSVAGALALIASTPRIDGAILDMNLGGDMVYPVADLLQARGMPFLLVTGYDRWSLPARFATVPRCEKPVAADRLIRALAEIVAPPMTG